MIYRRPDLLDKMWAACGGELTWWKRAPSIQLGGGSQKETETGLYSGTECCLHGKGEMRDELCAVCYFKAALWLVSSLLACRVGAVFLELGFGQSERWENRKGLTFFQGALAFIYHGNEPVLTKWYIGSKCILLSRYQIIEVVRHLFFFLICIF